MIILIPMGGKGQRFRDAGYTQSKPSLPLTDRFTGERLPMILSAMKDLPGIDDPANRILCVDLEAHEKDGTEARILAQYPRTIFIHDEALLDQAYGCYLAREYLETDEPLLIAACDNGMVFDLSAFEKASESSDCLVFSHTNDLNIERNPLAHSWLKLDEAGWVSEISLKRPLSDTPMTDHATTGVFWFRQARVFLGHLETMIAREDLFDGKYYVDRVIQYFVDAGARVGLLDVRYLCWGTPWDYETYEKTLAYWAGFWTEEKGR